MSEMPPADTFLSTPEPFHTAPSYFLQALTSEVPLTAAVPTIFRD